MSPASADPARRPIASASRGSGFNRNGSGDIVYEISFYILASLIAAGGMIAVTARGIERAMAGLAAVLGGTAGLCLLLDAFAVASGLAALHAGAMFVLVRWWRRNRAGNEALGAEPAASPRRFAAMLAAVALGTIIVTVAWTVPTWRDAIVDGAQPGGPGVLALLGGDHVLPLLVVAVIAVVAAIAMATARADARAHVAERSNTVDGIAAAGDSPDAGTM